MGIPSRFALVRALSRLPLIRQLGRPGFLTLQQRGKPAVFARLLALDDQSVVLELGGQTVQLPLAALSGPWDGDFSTYWRTPPGYSGELREGSGGTSVTWLAESLSRVEGLPAETTRGGAPVLDKALADWR